MRAPQPTPVTSAQPQPTQDLQMLFALAQDVECSPREWLCVVNRLPALQQRILQTINDCQVMAPQPITTIPQAIVNLGFNTVRNLACMAAG
jgi:HD-like signal output (HDOD) protein